MKELLTTAASIIVILFCFSALVITDEEERGSKSAVPGTQNNSNIHRGLGPPVKKELFTRVQSLKIQNGVLMFSTLERDKLQEHYFLLRDKNIVIIKKPKSEMPPHSIRFEDDGRSTMHLTIPDSFDIDLMQQLSSR